jgi:hypothetical protein
LKTLILILMACSVAAAQSSSELQKKYGKPQSETFRIRPEIDMTVSYGKTGLACRMVLEPVHYWWGAAKLDEGETFIKMSAVTEVFDELVPKEQRGSPVSGPQHGRVQWIYENVALVIDGDGDKVRRAVMVLKEEACK